MLNLEELLVVQNKVNKVIMENADREVMVEDLLLAQSVEYHEFINEIGAWKWWKKNHETNKERILDEVADIMAFYLSILAHPAIQVTLDLDKEKEYLNDVANELGHATSLDLLRATQALPLQASAMMILAILIAQNETGASIEEIEEAYHKKSAINIQRQETNY